MEEKELNLSFIIHLFLNHQQKKLGMGLATIINGHLEKKIRLDSRSLDVTLYAHKTSSEQENYQFNSQYNVHDDLRTH